MRHFGLRAAGNLRRVGDIGRRLDDVAGDGVERKSRLPSEQLGRFDDGIVDCGQLQHVGLDDEIAELRHGRRDRGNGQLAAIRRDALGERSERLHERRELAELDGLAAALRNRTLLAELVMHKVRLRLVEQRHVVVGLHLRRQTLGTGVVGRLALRIVGKELEPGRRVNAVDGHFILLSGISGR